MYVSLEQGMSYYEASLLTTEPIITQFWLFLFVQEMALGFETSTSLNCGDQLFKSFLSVYLPRCNNRYLFSMKIFQSSRGIKPRLSMSLAVLLGVTEFEFIIWYTEHLFSATDLILSDVKILKSSKKYVYQIEKTFCYLNICKNYVFLEWRRTWRALKGDHALRMHYFDSFTRAAAVWPEWAIFNVIRDKFFSQKKSCYLVISYIRPFWKMSHYWIKMTVTTFWRTFGKFGLIFISTSGHTECRVVGGIIRGQKPFVAPGPSSVKKSWSRNGGTAEGGGNF